MDSTPERVPTTAGIGSFVQLRSREPWGYFDQLRSLGDVVWDDELQTWVVCSHAAYRQLGRSDDRLWLKPNPTIDEQWLNDSALLELRGGRYGLIFLHGEMHTRAHRWMTRAFAPREVQKWRATLIRPVIASMLDRFVTDGYVEFVTQLTSKVPIRIMAALEGLPWADEDWIEHFRDLQGRANAHRSEFARAVDPEVSSRVLTAIDAMYELMMPFVRERKSGTGDDLISFLWREGPKLFDDWTERDVVSQARGQFDPGTDTTGKALANALYVLLTHPELRDELLSAGSRAVGNFADEVLRLFTPRLVSYRIARADVELAGVLIRKGESVTALIGAANRDPAAFSCPEAVDLNRPRPRDHVSFHVGPRFCAGAPLVRAQIEELTLAVLSRLPNLRLDPGAEQPKYEGVVSRQFRPLHALFDPTQSRR